MKRLVATAIALLALLTMAACVSKTPAEAEAEAAMPTGLEDPSALGDELVRTWLDMLHGEETDLVAMDSFLAENFQIQRDDGTRATKGEYLDAPATVNEYEIADLQAVAAGDDVGATVTVTFQLTVDEVINGEHIDATSPRIGTFVWADERWQLLSWGNFGTLDSVAVANTDDETTADTTTGDDTSDEDEPGDLDAGDEAETGETDDAAEGPDYQPTN